MSNPIIMRSPNANLSRALANSQIKTEGVRLYYADLSNKINLEFITYKKHLKSQTYHHELA